MFSIYLVVISDSTGETALQVAESASSQFQEVDFKIKRYGGVRSTHHLEQILSEILPYQPQAIFYSFVGKEKIKYIEDFAKANKILSVDTLSEAIHCLEELTQLKSAEEPGASRRMDERYFKRVDAVEFAVRYDDGKDPRGILAADITIIGISRTSKTPLSMYLANRNYRVCNIPLVPETPAPEELYEIDPSKIIGLTNSPEKLNHIRKERVKALGLPSNSSYSNFDRIFEELDYSHQIFRQLGCPVFDVSDRAIEETAELIIKHMRKFD